ncbi:MAG TPA: SAM-dependent methyltransferase [Nitrospiraceae bacterium]|nr:SAM-dependent methyltransferase [Nitrospiraceae bacterium]
MGTLYVVGLPIGNPEDVTLRALRVLRNADIVASKDPRHTRTFLRRHRVQALLTTYDRRNARDKSLILLDRLRCGSTVALVSDCGTPGLYDAGSLLVAYAHQAGIPVKSVPGPSALAASLAIAGMPGDTVFFQGGFPASKARATRLLVDLKATRCTSIFFVPPERLRRTLTLMEQCLGSRRQVVIAVNLTQPTERVLRGQIAAVLRIDPLAFPRDAVTLIVAGK